MVRDSFEEATDTGKEIIANLIVLLIVAIFLLPPVLVGAHFLNLIKIQPHILLTGLSAFVIVEAIITLSSIIKYRAEAFELMCYAIGWLVLGLKRKIKKSG